MNTNGRLAALARCRGTYNHDRKNRSKMNCDLVGEEENELEGVEVLASAGIAEECAKYVIAGIISCGGHAKFSLN